MDRYNTRVQTTRQFVWLVFNVASTHIDYFAMVWEANWPRRAMIANKKHIPVERLSKITKKNKTGTQQRRCQLVDNIFA